MEGERAGHFQAGASNATTPSGGNLPQRPSSATPLSAPPGSITGRTTPSFPNPVTRTPSACFPVTRVPSAQGLAMIRPNLHESTPPPTNMTWDEALAILHKLEKQLTLNVQTDLEKLRYRMTHSKIDLVARKSLRLYQMRVLLNTTRRLCREEEDIMADFGGVKAVIDSDPRGQIDEDDFMSTKSRLLTLGGKLTDNRRKQQRLASQVEELQGATKELVDTDQLTELNGYEFNMESFKRESSALPEMPRLAPSLPSYDLFNHAPYSPDVSRPGSAMSMESDRPGSALERVRERSLHRKLTVSVAVESTDEEEVASDAYLPQKHGSKKRKDLTRNKRAPSETASETSDGEEVYQVFTNPNNRMTTMEAKQKAEEDRKKAADEEAKLQKSIDFNIPNLIDEQLKREEEEEKRQKQKDEDEMKKSIPESKPKPAKIESKKKEPEEKKALDIKTQAQARQAEEQEKKKSATEAKQKIEAEQHKKEVEAKKQAKLEAQIKEKADLDAKQKEKEEEEAKKKADLNAKKKEKEENEARRKAELDAKQKEKEEAEAKKKADLDAKKKEKEETEARQKAELEAKMRSEELKQKEEAEKKANIEAQKQKDQAKKDAEAFKKAEANREAEAMKLAEAEKEAEAKKMAEEKMEAEAVKHTKTKRAAEAKRLADAEKEAEALKLAEAEKEAEAKKVAEEKMEAEAMKQSKTKLAAEAKRLADAEKEAEALRLAEAEKEAEAKKMAEEKLEAETMKQTKTKRAAEAKSLADAEKEAEALKLAEAEAKKIAEEKMEADALKQTKTKRAAEAKRLADAEKEAEALKLAEAEKEAEAKKIAEERMEAEVTKQNKTKIAAEAKRLADAEKEAEAEREAEAKKMAEEKMEAEAMKQAKTKRAAEAKRLADAEKEAEAVKLVEVEAKKLAEEKMEAEAMKQTKTKRAEETKRLAEAEKESEAIKLAEAEAVIPAKRKTKKEIVDISTERTEEATSTPRPEESENVASQQSKVTSRKGQKKVPEPELCMSPAEDQELCMSPTKALKQELELDLLEQQQAAIAQKPNSNRPRSREELMSSSGPQEGKRAANEEFFQEEPAQQDVFAAISDTSLKSGKKSRQRRARAKVEQDYVDTDEEDIPQKKPYKARTASRDRLQGNNGSAQDESSNLRSAKSRTASKERLKENESNISQQPKSAAAQSRTSSSKDGRISQHEMEIEETRVETMQSRPRSGREEAQDSRSVDMEVDIGSKSKDKPLFHHDLRSQHEQMFPAEDDELMPESTVRPVSRKGGRSRTSSDGQKVEAIVVTQQEQEQMAEVGRPVAKKTALSRTSSKEGQAHQRLTSRQASADDTAHHSRPPSRLSDLMSDQYEPELTWEDDEDMEEESLPSLAPMSRTGAKSRTTSGERREYEPDEPGAKIQALPRPGSRSLAQEVEVLGLLSEQEIVDKERAARRDKKSRTSSREKLKQDSFESQPDSYFEMESSEPEPALRPAKSRTKSAEGYTSRGAKSRTHSRERPRDFIQDLYPEEKLEFEEEQLRIIPRGAKSRTGSNEVHPGAKSRTASREGRPGSGGLQHQTPMWPEEEDSELSQNRTARSRTSSADRRKLVGGDRDALLAEDPGFTNAALSSPVLPTGPSPVGLRTYREEMELDNRQYTYDSGDQGDTFYPAQEDDDEPPPAEPIDYPEGMQQRPSRFPETFENITLNQTAGSFDSDFRYEEEHYDDDKDTSYSKSKKVSFAESDQKFQMKPDPDVKTIPGTKLYTFAPSSTHEQPQDSVSAVPVSESVKAPEEESQYSTAPSTTPKAFLKAMTKGIKGDNPQKAAKEGEKGGSFMDTVLRRQRSSSAQGSRSSSRQSSLDRDGKRAGGGSSQYESSAGSQELENMSETDSVGSFFKRKRKTKLIKTVDFDELFARGHAMSAQLEEQQRTFGLRPEVLGPMIHPPPTTTSGPSTPFELYSKETAFKMSQKGSGIGYEEKVASYLSDQQSTVHPSNDHQKYPFLEQDRRMVDQVDGGSAQIDNQTSSPYYEGVVKEAGASILQSEPPQRGSSSPYPDYRAKVGQDASPTPSVKRGGKRPMTPQEFLSTIQNFVKQADMDAHLEQPAVWPSGVQVSSEEEMPTKRTKHGESGLLAPPGYGPKPRDHSPVRPTEPSIFDSGLPQSFSPPDNGLGQIVGPSSGKSYLDDKPSTSPDPFGATIDEMDIPQATASDTASVSSSFLNSLKRQKKNRKKQQQEKQPQSQQIESADHVIQSVPSDYKQTEPVTTTSPGRGRSPKKSVSINAESSIIKRDTSVESSIIKRGKKQMTPQEFLNKLQSFASEIPPPISASSIPDTNSILVPADRHIPKQLKPDPLTGHEGSTSEPFLHSEPTSPHVVPTSSFLVPADRHIPNQLRPDPLSSEELEPFPNNLLASSPPYIADQSFVPSIEDSDLYKKLQLGLDRLMQTDKFQELACKADDPQSYSQHLGRAEFGTLQKRTTSQQAMRGIGGYSGQTQPRDLSNERSSSAMANMGGGGRGSAFSSQQPSRDSSLGRHDSRHVTHSIPEYYDDSYEYESFYDDYEDSNLGPTVAPFLSLHLFSRVSPSRSLLIRMRFYET